MKLGTSQIEITPQPGAELSGFAARLQPSAGVLDPLFAKAIYFACDNAELLWLHCDLIGFDQSIVVKFRRWAQSELGLGESQVMISATHTHAGPCTIYLREAGEFDPAYVEFLLRQMRKVARDASARTENCDLVTAEGRLDLAVDRRKQASAHTDPRVGALGFRRTDGTFAAVILNYAMHPVALGPKNRLISGDISGQAALALAESLPGKPIVFATNGACANLNPPKQNVPFAQVRQWGEQMANAVGALLLKTPPVAVEKLNVVRRVVPLPLEVLDEDGINQFAEAALRNADPLGQWGDKYRRVVEHWRNTVEKHDQNNGNGYHAAKLFGVKFDGVILLGANAEVFSEFTDLLRRGSDRKIYLVGYANGDVGYLPTLAAYAEGGYEVEVAHMFYGGFRPKAGGLELLAAAAADLVNELDTCDGSTARAHPSRAAEKSRAPVKAI